MTWDNLCFWCDVHGIVLKRESTGVRATAYDRANQPITTITRVMGCVDKTKDAELAAGILACDDIAEELLLLKPSIAFKLNQS